MLVIVIMCTAFLFMKFADVPNIFGRLREKSKKKSEIPFQSKGSTRRRVALLVLRHNWRHWQRIVFKRAVYFIDVIICLIDVSGRIRRATVKNIRNRWSVGGGIRYYLRIWSPQNTDI
jgi:hypothetical protein